MQYDAPLRKLKEEERILLEALAAPEIANFPETDTSPENIAVRTKALAILEKDTLDYQGSPLLKNLSNRVKRNYSIAISNFKTKYRRL